MRRVIVLLGLEFYALLLAGVQALSHVRTDEAKYMLNIAYPHPPLARWILSQIEWWTFAEHVWRIVFASLLVQAVWVVWDMGRDLRRDQRLVLCAGWLLSGGVVLQAGGVMMAPLTALQGLLFLWLLHRSQMQDLAPWTGLIGLLWIASLFTALQGVLLLPLVVTLVDRMRLPPWRKAATVGAPLVVLVLYCLANPLVLASVAIHSTKDATLTLAQHIWGGVAVWMIGGSIVLSLLGVWGMVSARRGELLLSFLVVLAYVTLSRYDYYAVLFTPLLIAGFTSLLEHERWSSALWTAAMVAGLAIAVTITPPTVTPNPAREIMRRIAEQNQRGEVLISGSFGHEWQFESRFPIRRYRPEFLAEAQAVVCLQPCEGIEAQGDFEVLQGAPVEVWVGVP